MCSPMKDSCANENWGAKLYGIWGFSKKVSVIMM